MTHGAMDKTIKPQYWMMSNGHLQARPLPPLQRKKLRWQLDRRFCEPNSSYEPYAGEANKWTVAFVGLRAIVNGTRERKTSGHETWWVQGQSERYVGDSNMQTGDLVGSRTV